MDPRQSFQQAVAFQQAGKPAEAEQLCLDILEAAPGFIPALHLLGLARVRQGRGAEALAALDAVLRGAPTSPPLLTARAKVLEAMGRADEALAAVERALATAPGEAALWNQHGSLLRKLHRPQEALASFDRALAIKPGEATLLGGRGLALAALGRHQEALACFDHLVARGSAPPDIHHHRALALCQLGQFEAALESFDAVLARERGYPDVHNNRGIALRRLQRPNQALASFAAALAIDPGHVAALNNHSVTLWELGRAGEALPDLENALSRAPQDPELLHNHGISLFSLHRFEEAAASFEAALARKPDHSFALGALAGAVLHLCDFARAARLGEEIISSMAKGHAIVPPLTLLSYSNDPALQLAAARAAITVHMQVKSAALWNGEVYDHDRIRIAYISSDFRRHPVGHQIVELIERHDRDRFEVTGISHGPDDGSEIRARLAKAFDHFHDLRQQDDRAIAEILRRAEIDIAIDLNGHTEGGRLGILLHRPAPVQVSYLGYAGTTGADFIDHVIADSHALPLTQQAFYSERIVHLPDSFWVADSTDAVAASPTRAEAGLPESGFVFCCFNHHAKINREIFEVWMRLLMAVPASLLWLRDGLDVAKANLGHEAAARGVDPERLVFAGRVDSRPAHLARLTMADVFLDTLPYNAHATASDALWAGVPVITARGESFSGRVAASQLHALGLGELATENLKDYRTLALRLAQEPALLAALRAKLKHNCRTMPLFDMTRQCRHIERIYTAMHERGSQTGGNAIAPSP